MRLSRVEALAGTPVALDALAGRLCEVLGADLS
jgi:hypothetical protein